MSTLSGPVSVIELSGTLEVSKQARFKESLLKQLPTPPSRTVLDFKAVDFIDSACLGALIAVTRIVREKGGDIRLTGLNPEVSSVFQITRLDKVFSIFSNSEEAIKSFS